MIYPCKGNIYADNLKTIKLNKEFNPIDFLKIILDNVKNSHYKIYEIHENFDRYTIITNEIINQYSRSCHN